jgi:hypothetical protein
LDHPISTQLAQVHTNDVFKMYDVGHLEVLSTFVLEPVTSWGRTKDLLCYKTISPWYVPKETLKDIGSKIPRDF